MHEKLFTPIVKLHLKVFSLETYVVRFASLVKPLLIFVLKQYGLKLLTPVSEADSLNNGQLV